MQESIIYTKFTTELRFLLFFLWQRRKKKKRKQKQKTASLLLLGNLRNPTGSALYMVHTCICMHVYKK